MKKISFVVLTWNRYKMLQLCLDNLLLSIQDKYNCEIVIYNNGSTDQTDDVISSFIEKNSGVIEINYINKKQHIGLKAYKKLFSIPRSDYIIEVDDDVIEFPIGIDSVFIKYFNEFRSYGFIALDVVQNEFTNGAKPPENNYTLEESGGLYMERGPTGGWCSGFRRVDFRKVSFLFNLLPINMKHGEDGLLVKLFSFIGLKSGIAKGIKCFHASGPHYSREFEQLERDILKYKNANMKKFVGDYKEYE